MAIQIDKVENIPNPYTQNPVVFEQNVVSFTNSALPTFINQVNVLSVDLTGKWSNVNYWTGLTEGYKSSTLSYMNDALNYKNLAYGYKVAAQSAANRAETVVIPIEDTYNLDALEVALNGLLTQIVAQQAQIKILMK